MFSFTYVTAMFLISDSLATRQAKINRFLDGGEPAIGLLLAAVDFERTVRRAILALGVTPTRELAFQLGRPRPANWEVPHPKPPRYPSSLNGYAKAWDKDLHWLKKDRLLEILGEGVELRNAIQLRHDLVHGDRGTTGANYARSQSECLMRATSRVSAFARANAADLEKPIPRRLKHRHVGDRDHRS